MNNIKDNSANTIVQKDFWESLQHDILFSKQTLSPEDTFALIEQNFMFSLFFRGFSYIELINFQTMFDLNDIGYLILMSLSQDVHTQQNNIEINELSIYHFIKKSLPKKLKFAIGPLISNRISILVTSDTDISLDRTKEESIDISKDLINHFKKEANIVATAGIGKLKKIQSIYSSYIEAQSCLSHCKTGQVLHKQDLEDTSFEFHFDYEETEKYMLDAIRHKKVEAYDYFSLLMNHIQKLNDCAARNRIIEILVLAAHTVQKDSTDDTQYFNYSKHLNELANLTGTQLIEWAYKRFIYITGYVKTQNSIDYSNKIVQATKEYLEAHYTEDITLEDVAEQVNISPQYFSKLIKKNTGFNFIDWLSMLRVKKAKELLTNSDLTVKEVCFMVGYKDPNYFSRIFKKRMGITPSDYIKNSNFLSRKN
ncbi:helix-turn-helix transcriptional regulator [Mobilitalea sibirica]|uniref:Helix-turn-helix transcriptional regulator n=1 Tax=Mobilitalea sibirica TaxID=1462919 RepID=A0A8J7H2S7_9FIRM|nr:helix-turn-helix domain-containing protein [Mobilitalea sibirica]MBH1941189.1 helix-turn-helix transcriptional regulator [Mobilitalea sibirica]